MPTLNALALELIRAHGDKQDDPDYVLTVEQWIRDALDELALETDWRAFITDTTLNTAAGTSTYTLPINVRDIRFLRDPNNENSIIFLPKDRMVDLGLDLEKLGRPDFWAFESVVTSGGNTQYNIRFQPIPDAVYPLGVAFNLVIGNIGSLDTIPVQNDMLLPLRLCTRSYMALDDEDFDAADVFYNRFLLKTDKLVKRELTKFAEQLRFQQRDIPSRGADRRLARLDPNHF